MSHYRRVCEYGLNHGQCRCPGPKDIKRIKCDMETHQFVKRTGKDWNEIYPVVIMDPDGWRHNDGVDYDTTEISLEDFASRLGECTVQVLDLKHFPNLG